MLHQVLHIMFIYMKHKISVMGLAHILSLWAQLESIIKKIFFALPSLNIELFLREYKFRLINYNINSEEKLNIIKDIFKYIGDTTQGFSLYEKKDLKSLSDVSNYEDNESYDD